MGVECCENPINETKSTELAIGQIIEGKMPNFRHSKTMKKKGTSKCGMSRVNTDVVPIVPEIFVTENRQLSDYYQFEKQIGQGNIVS